MLTKAIKLDVDDVRYELGGPRLAANHRTAP